MKLFVGNLPFSMNEEALRNLFLDYNAEEVTLIKDKFSGRSRGFGFVTIVDDKSAKKAISELNGKEVEGREIRVSEAKPLGEKPRRNFSSRRNFNKKFNF